MITCKIRVAALVLAIGMQGAAMAAPKYTITDLGVLAGGGSDVRAYGVNNLGQVVGVDDGRAFIWKSGSMTALPLGSFQGYYGDQWSINDSGVVVGAVNALVSTGWGSQVTSRGAIWYPDQNPQEVGTIAKQSNWNIAVYSKAIAINELNHVVGSGMYTDSGTHAFIRDGAGLRDLGSLNGNSVAVSLNDNDWAVGCSYGLNGPCSTATLWRDGQIIDLGGASNQSGATDINNAGTVVGWSQSGGIVNAVYWNNEGMHLLGASSSALAINESEQIVGISNSDATLWQDGTTLNLSLLPEVSEAGWVLHSVTDINDLGQIVGYGRYQGATRAFLLSPVPEPTTYAMMLVGLGLIGALVRCNRQAESE